MSTNFYWIPQENVDWPTIPDILLPTGEYVVPEGPAINEHSIHIGKRYHGKDGMTFIFAIRPKTLLDTLLDWQRADHKRDIIRDEYGRQFNADKFEVLLYDCNVWDLESIGKEFC